MASTDPLGEIPAWVKNMSLELSVAGAARLSSFNSSCSLMTNSPVGNSREGSGGSEWEVETDLLWKLKSKEVKNNEH